MSRTIAIANQKGGVGKTTTTINLAAALADTGLRILVIDADPQGNTTSGLGVDKAGTNKTLYELLLGDMVIKDCIQSGVYDGVSLLPSNVDLAAAEIELIGIDRKEYILRTEMDWVRDKYDFILIDCPPSLNVLTINALVAADSVLVPIQCEFYALEGLTQLIHTVNLVKDRLNPNLAIDGIVFTMYDARTNLSADVVDNVKRNLGGIHLYKTMIPRNIRLAEAPSHGVPITAYDAKSAGAEAYAALAKEFIRHNEIS